MTTQGLGLGLRGLDLELGLNNNIMTSMSLAVVDGRPTSQIIVSFSMRRQLSSVFMVTYLPTILMNAMNQATVYIE